MTAGRLAEIYPQVASTIYRRCFALLGHREDALDAVQDIYLLLHKKIGSFRGEALLTTWIYRVATNHCLGVLRTQRVRSRALTKLPTPAPSVEEEVSSAFARRRLLEQLLRQFGQRKVAIAVHRYCHGMKQAEIAEVMGISDRAVRKALATFIGRAKQTIEALEGAGEG